MPRHRLGMAAVLLSAPLLAAPLIAAPSAASAAPGLAYTTPVQLTGAAGGEPSIATDQQGDVYVSGPQGIPSGANGGPGVGIWVSHDNATSFTKAALVGSFLGGGDSDLTVAPDAARTVYVTDLEAAAAAICKSVDKGRTFTSVGPVAGQQCTNVPVGQAGPSDDRQYLTAGPDGHTIYLTYHEFVSAQPVAFRSDNSGADNFSNPCGPLVTDPAIQANVPTDITGGTLVSKPVVDKQGNLYVLFTTTTQAQNAAALAAGQLSGTFSQVYMAVSTDHCASFTDHTVFDGSALGTNTVQFGDVFNALAIDGAGNLYGFAAGYVGTTPFAKTTDAFLFSSRDGGKTWTKPVKVGSAGAHMLPAAVGGPQAGQLALGFYRTTNGVTDPNDPKGVWTYSTAVSTDAASASPTFTLADVRPGFVYHSGIICNQGILCTSGRDLLDFTSATIDANGCAIYAFAANPDGVAKGTFNYVTRQTSGCFTTQSVAAPQPAAAAGPAVASPGPAAAPTAPTTATSGRTLAFTGLTRSLPVLAGLLLLAGLVLHRWSRSRRTSSERS